MESCDDPFLLTTLLTPNIGVFTPRQAIFQRFLQVRSHTDYLASGQTPPMSGSVPEGRPHVRCQSQWQAVTGTPGWPVINGAREPNVKAGCIQRSSCADQPYGHAARTHAEQRKMPAGVASRLLPHAIKGVLGNSLHTAPAQHKRDHSFPRAKTMGKLWIKGRDCAASHAACPYSQRRKGKRSLETVIHRN